MRLLAVLFAGAPWLCAQADALPPHLLLLAKIRQQMIANLHRPPNYTCLETVKRSHRCGAAGKFERLARAPLMLKAEGISGRELLEAEPWTISAPRARPGEGITPLGLGRVRLHRGILTFWRTIS